jgi:hypothetical protein
VHVIAAAQFLVHPTYEAIPPDEAGQRMRQRWYPAFDKGGRERTGN